MPPGKWPARVTALEVPPLPMQGAKITDGAGHLLNAFEKNWIGRYVNLDFAIMQMYMYLNAKKDDNEYKIHVWPKKEPSKSVLITIDAAKTDKLVCELSYGNSKKEYSPLNWRYIKSSIYEGRAVNPGHFVDVDDLKILMGMDYEKLLGWMGIEEEEKTGKIYVAVNNVNVRDLPSLDGTPTLVSEGTRFTALSSQPVNKDNHTWIQVRYDGSKTGWIALTSSIKELPEKREITVPETIEGIVNGKKVVLTPKSSWGLPGNGEYGEGVQKDANGRYKVAVGPKIIDPKYPDEGKIWEDDFKYFNRNIDAVLEHVSTGAVIVLECISTDIKAHSFNKYGDTASFNVESGLLQTGIRYPKASNGLAFAPNNIDGSVIEFAGHATPVNCNDYKLIKIITF